MLLAQSPQAGRLFQSTRALAEGRSESLCVLGCVCVCVSVQCNLLTQYVIILLVLPQVCRDRRCQNASFTELETCIARCHRNGVGTHTLTHTHAESCNRFNSLSCRARLPNLIVTLCPWAKVVLCTAVTKSVVKGRKIYGWNTTATEVMNYLLEQYKQA